MYYVLYFHIGHNRKYAQLSMKYRKSIIIETTIPGVQWERYATHACPVQVTV